MSVVTKATDLLMLTDEAKGRLNALLSQSAQTLENEIGSLAFQTYISLPEDADPFTDDAHEIPNPAYIAYESLTSDQKLRRNLETAQACFLLYHTITSSKQISAGAVLLTKATAGAGSLNPSDVGEIDQLRKMLWNKGIDLCNVYRSTGGMSVFVV